MQTLTVQITDTSGLKALHALEEKRFIRIVDQVKSDSPSLPGQALSFKAFREWISQSEDAPTVDLKAAKAKWANKRKQLLKLSK